MTKDEALVLKSRYNALLVGAQAGLQEAAEIRKALSAGTGKAWHTNGPAFANLNTAATSVEALPSYGKGAAFEKRPSVCVEAAPAVPVPQANGRRYFN